MYLAQKFHMSPYRARIKGTVNYRDSATRFAPACN
jgi:hypothetical protein